MGVKTGINHCTDCYISGEDLATSADVAIRTSDGQSILAHSSILASASPVLERKIDRARKGWNSACTIRIPGAPPDAVIAFLQLLYSARKTSRATTEIDDILEKHGMQLLVLSHAYQIGWLKKKCENTVATELTPDRVIDVLKVSKMCDAPQLYQQCMKLIAKDFAEVQISDGWQFLGRYDPALELEILEVLEETDERKRKWKQQRAAQEVYQQLSKAIDCLKHIFTEGCTNIEPRNSNTNWSKKNRSPCARYGTCHRVQLLLRHFSTCRKKLTPGGCLQCQRMWQLLQLHASICNHSDSCQVPLCNDNRFEVKMQREGRSDRTWRLLVQRVSRVRVMSALASRKMPETVLRSCAECRQ